MLHKDNFYQENDGTVSKYTCKVCYSKLMKPITAKQSDYRRTAKSLIEEAINNRLQKQINLLMGREQKILTDNEWYELCRHFDGCAMCNSEYSDTKAVIIKPVDGGKLTRHNVLPMCSKCFSIADKFTNMFASFHPDFNSKSTIQMYKRFIDKASFVVSRR